MDPNRLLDMIDEVVHSDADEAEITTFVIAALGLRIPTA